MSLPRVHVVDGNFAVGQTNARFRPQGFNYIRLNPTWHRTFAPKHYDAERAEKMFARLASDGFNTVRVFVDPSAGPGVVDSRQAMQLSKKYMANVCDFLARGRKHGVYTIFAILGLPSAKVYDDMVGRDSGRWSVGNVMYLDKKYHQAKARYVSDFVKAIQGVDPGLLSAVLSYELDNETRLYVKGVFARGEGQATGPDGKEYDLSDNDQLQALADASVIMWANASVEAVKKVDPQAMVSINVFSFRAVRRKGPGDILHAKTGDKRFPARPLALTQSKLDYIDIHFYPFNDKTLADDLKSIEFDRFLAAADRASKPVIVGEFGAFRGAWKSIDQAVPAMKRQLQATRDKGFDGFVYWTYDTDEQGELWNALSDKGQIYDLLKGMILQPHIKEAKR